METDKIVKKVLLRAPRKRVWRALTDSKEFGTWFGVRFDAPFTVGVPTNGVVRPTKLDAEFAEAQRKYEGLPFVVTVEEMRPETVFSFRWQPALGDEGANFSSGPTTLVEFLLDEEGDKTMLTLSESGFDKIPLARRARAFSDNEKGWEAQMKLVEKYLAQYP